MLIDFCNMEVFVSLAARLSVQEDPVVLIQSGQTYDRKNIEVSIPAVHRGETNVTLKPCTKTAGTD